MTVVVLIYENDVMMNDEADLPGERIMCVKHTVQETGKDDSDIERTLFCYDRKGTPAVLTKCEGNPKEQRPVWQRI